MSVSFPSRGESTSSTNANPSMRGSNTQPKMGYFGGTRFRRGSSKILYTQAVTRSIHPPRRRARPRHVVPHRGAKCEPNRRTIKQHPSSIVHPTWTPRLVPVPALRNGPREREGEPRGQRQEREADHARDEDGCHAISRLLDGRLRALGIDRIARHSFDVCACRQYHVLRGCCGFLRLSAL